MNETMLLLAFTEPDGTLARPALEALGTATSASQAAGAPLAIGLIGAVVDPAASQIGAAGARLFAVTGEAFAVSRYATDALAAEALARATEATLIVSAGTSRAARCLPGVAQRLGGRADTHVTHMAATDGRVSVDRWYYRQRIDTTATRTARPWIVLVEPGCTVPWSSEPASPPAVHHLALDVPVEALRTRVVGVQAPPADQQTVRPDADLLFVAGAGWTKTQRDGQVHAREAEALILGFLQRSQASLGGSKSLVDMGGDGQPVLPFMNHLNQVGQTGSTPRHRKGLATCCHGEEPHVVGWRFITERRAVNLNPNCGWAQGKADVLYVADAFEVMAKVNALLDARASG
ncbi:MAG: electron transfer flavoprotein subunit alpha [Acidobacteria bacterium]|nr:electron transfer flavoprotein subunit alpha [Acidobacteriota bacterium]